MMEQGITYTAAGPVASWRTAGPWRGSEKRARLDAVCAECRDLRSDDRCVTHA